jgi:hypothetical protein
MFDLVVARPEMEVNNDARFVQNRIDTVQSHARRAGEGPSADYATA